MSVNNTNRTIESVEIDALNSKLITIKLVDYLFYQDAVKVSYSGTSVSSIYNSFLEVFTELIVNNNLVARFFVPGKIQAEDFNNQYGLEIENTSDSGAGQNIGYTDAGDYADYFVYISESGHYDLSIRAAAQWDVGKIGFEVIYNENTQSIAAIDVPVTNGWQSWQTTTTQVVLDAGIYTLKMKVLKSGFNLNWFDFKFVGSLSIKDSIIIDAEVYPNPITGKFQIKLNNQQSIKNIQIIDMNGRLVKKINTKLPNSIYNLSNLKAGIYFLLLETDKGHLQKKIIKI